MTINYTTLLGLAKPVTGTETGQWGDVVNNEITSLVEDAVANAATFSVTSGNVTLTTTNGASNQARMSTLIITGTPGTSRNVVAPSQAKIYVVVNQSDSSVVIKGSATTGVTVPAGRTMQVAWNGSDFVDVSTSFAANGSANGVVYLNASKVPTAGTALVFDGTNLGVGATSPGGKVEIYATSGQNLVLNGTGTSSIQWKYSGTATAFAQLYSTSEFNIGTSTAIPMMFYTNNTEVARFTSAGNFGIGTGSPSGKLHAYISSSAQLIFQNSSQNNLYLSGTNASMIVDSTGSSYPGYFVKTQGTTNGQITNIGGAAASGIAMVNAAGNGIVVDGSGYVGIGVTPANMLDVYQATVGIGAARLRHVNGNQINVQPSYNYYDAYNHIFRSLSGTTEYGRFIDTGSFGINVSSPTARLEVQFSTTQSGIKCYPSTYVYPGYSILSTNGVVGTVKSGSGTIRLVDIRAQEQTSLANGQVIGGYFQIDNPNAAVNANGGQIGVYGVVNGVDNYTTGHQYGVCGRAGSGGTWGVGVMAVLGADQTITSRAALLAKTDNTTDRIASFHNSGGEYIQINGLGSLGLQITPNRWFSNRSVIQMGSSVSAISGANGYEFGLNFYVAETTALDKRVQSGYANKVASDAAVGDIVWSTAGTGAADSNISWGEKARLTNGGYFLLGTSSTSGSLSNSAPAIVGQALSYTTSFGATNAGVNCDVTGIPIGAYLVTVQSSGTYHSRATYWVGAYDTADYGYGTLGSSGYGAAQTVTVIGVAYNNITFRVSFGNNVSGVSINVLRLG